MSNRSNTFLWKRSNVAGKVPISGDLLLGEMALNTADVKLYASGTTSNSILPIGWDRVSRTGDTMTGTLFLPTLSATTIYGDGSNITGIIDTYVTGVTYSANTLTISQNEGQPNINTTIGLVLKSDTVLGSAFAGNPKVYSVVFDTPYSDSGYTISITGSINRSFTWTNKTTTGFTINANANPAFNSSYVDWQTIKIGES